METKKRRQFHMGNKGIFAFASKVSLVSMPILPLVLSGGVSVDAHSVKLVQ